MLQVVFNRSNRGLKSQLKKYLLPGLRDAVDTLAERIVQGCPVTGNEGKTLWPTNTKDKFKYGVRIDWGGQLSQATDGKWYRDLNLQINASAEQKSIQELGQKMGTDYKYVTLLIPVTSEGKCKLDPVDLSDQFLSGFVEGIKNGGI